MSRSGKELVRVGEGIKTLIGILKTRLSRNEYVNGIPKEFVRRLGGRYWKWLRSEGKMTYLRMQSRIIEDDPSSDNHIGDADFQNTVIGGVSQYITAVSSFMNKIFSDPKDGAVFEWPDKLKSMINTSMSSFEYGKLIQDMAGYFPDMTRKKETNGRRYDKDGHPLVQPVNQTALKHFFAFSDQLWSGIEYLMSLEPDEQETKIIEGAVSGSNCGYPFFTTQTKKNFKKLWRKFLKIYLRIEIEDKIPLTVDEIFKIIHKLQEDKCHMPFVLFYRTQMGRGVTKHRSVFGAHIVQKMLAALFSAAKEYAFLKAEGFTVDKRCTKYIYSVGNIPIVAQLNWDEMFNIILDRLPDFVGSELKPMSSDEIRTKFNVVVQPGIYVVNAIGEDFARFDQGIIYEDLVEITKHRKLGWIYQYLLDDLRYSEVWSANIKFLMIFYKSGHFMTSEFGSYFHRKCDYNAAEHKSKMTGLEVIILAACMLSDDSIEFVINLEPKDISEYLQQFGLDIKIDDSFNYGKHKVIEFLKVLVGYVLSDGAKAFVGDPTSRYAHMAHSERDIEQDLEHPEDFKGDVKAVYRVTGDIELDAFLSKLASFGNKAKSIVYTILRILKDTKLGRSAIMAISHIDPNARYELYRGDVLLGFSPAWLGGLEVQALLFEDRSYQ